MLIIKIDHLRVIQRSLFNSRTQKYCNYEYEALFTTRRFNYQMQLNWFHRASDKKAVQELESLVSCEVCY